MNLIAFPDIPAMFESVKNAGYEREVADMLVSAALSAWVSAMWRLGQKKFFNFAADAATAMYLSLRALEKKNLLTLTVPKDLLDAGNLSRFQTEEKA